MGTRIVPISECSLIVAHSTLKMVDAATWQEIRDSEVVWTHCLRRVIRIECGDHHHQFGLIQMLLNMHMVLVSESQRTPIDPNAQRVSGKGTATNMENATEIEILSGTLTEGVEKVAEAIETIAESVITTKRAVATIVVVMGIIARESRIVTGIVNVSETCTTKIQLVGDRQSETIDIEVANVKQDRMILDHAMQDERRSMDTTADHRMKRSQVFVVVTVATRTGAEMNTVVEIGMTAGDEKETETTVALMAVKGGGRLWRGRKKTAQTDQSMDVNFYQRRFPCIRIIMTHRLYPIII